MYRVEQLDEEPLSEIVRYRSGTPQDAVAFSGTIRKHPYDESRCILFSESAGEEPSVLEFRKSDILSVEELPSPVDATGQSRSVMKLWIRRGSLGIRHLPFEVDEPLRYAGANRLKERLAPRARG
jgi:hypothetical protein